MLLCGQIGSDHRIDQRDGEGDMIADPFLNYFALGLLFFVSLCCSTASLRSTTFPI